MKPRVQYSRNDISTIPGPAGQARSRAGQIPADIPTGSGQAGNVPRPGNRRHGPVKRPARVLDRPVSRVQEWLEAPSRQWEEKIACIIIALTAFYFLIRLCAFLMLYL